MYEKVVRRVFAFDAGKPKGYVSVTHLISEAHRNLMDGVLCILLDCCRSGSGRWTTTAMEGIGKAAFEFPVMLCFYAVYFALPPLRS
jgi:hypothetical protein